MKKRFVCLIGFFMSHQQFSVNRDGSSWVEPVQREYLYIERGERDRLILSMYEHVWLCTCSFVRVPK